MTRYHPHKATMQGQMQSAILAPQEWRWMTRIVPALILMNVPQTMEAAMKMPPVKTLLPRAMHHLVRAKVDILGMG